MINNKVIIRNLVQSYGDLPVLRGVNIEVREGETLGILGPSGCGKTSLLKAIAGFLSIQSGSILLNGREVQSLPPQNRQTAMIFQNYALFPQMTVLENIAYGLKIKRYDKKRIQEEVRKIVDLLKLDGLENRPVSALSGGQQQRVAIGRALIIRPSLLLFDEPLSNLDENLRGNMRSEIRGILKSFGLTSIYVTHDRDEALVMSDRIAIFRDGLIEQVGIPSELYYKPKNSWVANFLGYRNLFPLGTSSPFDLYSMKKMKIPKGMDLEKTLVLIRPEDIDIIPGQEKIQKHNPQCISFSGRVIDIEMSTAVLKYQVETSIGLLDVLTINRSVLRMISKGEPVTLTLFSKSFHFLEGGQL